MKIYISIVTDKKTGIREIGRITEMIEFAEKFHKDKLRKENMTSHTELWKLSKNHEDFEFVKEYVTDEDWNLQK